MLDDELSDGPSADAALSSFGLGIVGLTTTALLARFPLARLSAYDLFPLRRNAAASLWARCRTQRMNYGKPA